MYVFPLLTWVSCVYSDFLPHAKDLPVALSVFMHACEVGIRDVGSFLEDRD